MTVDELFRAQWVRQVTQARVSCGYDRAQDMVADAFLKVVEGTAPQALKDPRYLTGMVRNRVKEERRQYLLEGKCLGEFLDLVSVTIAGRPGEYEPTDGPTHSHERVNPEAPSYVSLKRCARPCGKRVELPPVGGGAGVGYQLPWFDCPSCGTKFKPERKNKGTHVYRKRSCGAPMCVAFVRRSKP